ncbi:MAG: hypothetical protein E7Z70_07650 [Thermoplasmata archaeon]|nr:hypothetical protein [Thermoplasmata archaeon]
MKSSFIAIIVVVMLILVGMGAYFAYSSGNPDDVSTDLKVGDSTTVETYYSGEVTKPHEAEVTDILESYLYSNPISEGEITGTDTVEYKGTKVACDLYEAELEGSQYKAWVEPESGIVYMWEMTNGNTLVVQQLLDTSFDLTKTMEEQTVTNGSFVEYHMEDSTGATDRTYTVSEISEDSCKITSTYSVDVDEENEYTIAAIDGDTLTMTDGSTMKKNDFIALVSHFAYEKYLKDSGLKPVYGEKQTEEIETAFGLKEVTVQDVVCTNESGEEYTIMMYYDDKGIIYKLEERSEGFPVITSDLKASTLIEA